MIELLLYGTVPAARHDQLLHILAGHTAMRPVPNDTHHVLLRPRRAPPVKRAPIGGSQDIKQPPRPAAAGASASGPEPLTTVRLVRELGPGRRAGRSRRASRQDDGGHPDVGNPTTTTTTTTDAVPETPDGVWTLRVEDVPEPGQRPVVVRTVQETAGIEGDVGLYAYAMGYHFIAHHIQSGHYLVHGNLLLRLARVLLLPPPAAQQTSTSTSASATDSAFPHDALPALADLPPLDPTGGYLLEVSVRLPDGAKPELVQQAVAELEAFRAQMKGVVPLRAPDRLAMDTRVR